VQATRCDAVVRTLIFVNLLMRYFDSVGQVHLTKPKQYAARTNPSRHMAINKLNTQFPGDGLPPRGVSHDVPCMLVADRAASTLGQPTAWFGSVSV
jgi:hypothetical protein